MEQLGGRIKALRCRLGLSQAGFADEFNIPKNTLQDWEHNRRMPPIYVVEMIEKLIAKDSDITSSIYLPLSIGLFAGAGRLALGIGYFHQGIFQ